MSRHLDLQLGGNLIHYTICQLEQTQTLAANVINMGAPLILNAFKCKHHRRNVVKVEEDVLLHSHDYDFRHSRPHTLYSHTSF